MVVIRADANAVIGSGHVMRCLSIANAFIRLGEKVLFVTADHEADALLKDREVRHLVLDTDYRNMEEEQKRFFDMLQKETPFLLIVDSYFVTEAYLGGCRELVPTVYLDDYGTTVYPVDVLINYNIQASEETYRELYRAETEQTCGQMPLFLTGLSYVPLRHEFCGYCPDTSKEVTDILLSTGGADPQNVSATMAAAWMKKREAFAGVRLHIICGPFYKHLPELAHMAAEDSGIVIHSDVKDMAALMKQCQLAVASTGSTIYELCAMGLPTVSFYFVENQRRIAEGFEQKTPVCSEGDFSLNPSGVTERVFARIQEYTASQDRRRTVSSTMQKLVDGKGADRIAAECIRMAKVIKEEWNG